MVIIISLSQVSSSCLVKHLLRLFVIFFQETEITTSEHVIVSFITIGCWTGHVRKREEEEEDNHIYYIHDIKKSPKAHCQFTTTTTTTITTPKYALGCMQHRQMKTNQIYKLIHNMLLIELLIHVNVKHKIKQYVNTVTCSRTILCSDI